MGPLPVIALSLLSEKLSTEALTAVDWAALKVKDWYKTRPLRQAKDTANADILKLDNALSDGNLDEVMAQFARSRDYVESRLPGRVSDPGEGPGGGGPDHSTPS